MTTDYKRFSGGAAILNMAVFAENFQNYRKKIEPKDSKTSKTHCKTKLFARRWSIFRIAGVVPLTRIVYYVILFCSIVYDLAHYLNKMGKQEGF
mgnify:CR=1 FL=1